MLRKFIKRLNAYELAACMIAAALLFELVALAAVLALKRYLAGVKEFMP